MAHRPLFAASRWLPCVVAALTAACGGETARGPDTDVVPGPSGPHESPPGGTAVTLQLPQALRAELDSLRAAQAEVKGLTPDGFAARYPVSHVQSLGYDPTQAKGLDLIQASNLGLSADELAGVATNGFVLSKARRFPTFAYGYASLYADDLPLYISADSILDAVHRSFDKVLQQTELNVLIPELGALLRDLRARLAVAESLDRGVRADVDVYLAVALGLLSGAPAAPAAGGDPGAIASLVDAATKASGGIQKIKLFGVPREVDVSQFKPRGHYTDSEELSAYFRAMMWLGRIDFRLIETKETGEQVFHRRQLDAMLALHSLFDTGSIERHRAIDSAIETFVGESDNMKVSEVASLLADLGAAPGAPTVTASDADIAQRLLDGGYGAQRIASDLMINATADGSPLPLHRTFLVFGQRYTVDSHVFSNVVFDRVAGRMMPDPLDAAFAALGNDQAGALLAPELSRYPYAPALASMRILVDAHEPAYWESTLYTTWLSALRALSPGETTGDPASLGLPLVTGTEPWGRRILNTQLGSWAQLRHDTILYVKQSYTGGAVCEFPDAYVDPYPEFYAALERFAGQIVTKIVPIAERGGSPTFGTQLADHFGRVKGVMSTLRSMAEHERSGTPFTAEQMEFVNDAVTVSEVCGSATANGWYPRLVYGDNPTEFDPTIADVHTQPYDEGGGVVGKVLHVGTGAAHLMVVTANTCDGPRAYAGLAGSYYEKTTEQFERLTDEIWKKSFSGEEPPRPAWISDVLR